MIDRKRTLHLLFTLMTLILWSCRKPQQAMQSSLTEPTKTLIPTNTINPMRTQELSPKPEYEICPEYKELADCYISAEDLLNGDYYNWLDEVVGPELLSWFQEHEDTIAEFRVMYSVGGAGQFLIIRPASLPNFSNPETAPFIRESIPGEAEVTFGYTTYGDDYYRVLPVFFYDKEEGQVYPVITITKHWGEADSPDVLVQNTTYVDDMNITPIVREDGFNGSVDPIVSQSFDNVGRDEIEDMFTRFEDDLDLSALSVRGAIFLTQVARSELLH